MKDKELKQALINNDIARIYGKRRGKRVTEKLIQELSVEQECI